MATSNTDLPRTSRWLKPVAVLAMVFGLMTLFSGGNVLFGPSEAQQQAGDYVPFVVWFNFLAGFLYVAAGIGIWLRRDWAFGLAVFIAIATGLIAVGFGLRVFQGDAYEMRTVGALTLRIGVWLVIAVALSRARRR